MIPLTEKKYREDDIVERFCEFLKVVYGENSLEKNLDFIAGALGGKGTSSREIIRNYFLNGFYKDHCSIYQKRPIYWLYDSGRQIGVEERRREHLRRQVEEVREYDERLEHMANEHISIDLDDGVKQNYEKVQTDRNGVLYQILAPIK